jgi:PAS domain-containing protein
MLLGTRVGLAWTVVAVAQTVVFLVLSKHGIAIRNDVIRLDRAEAVMSIHSTALVAFFLLVRVYENLKDRMVGEVNDSKRAVERAHQSARTVLDNVAQGLLIADRDGKIQPERSAAVRVWFGDLPEGSTVFDCFGALDPRFAEWLRIGWGDIFEDVLPMEVVLDQLPAKLVHAGRHFSVAYRPVGAPGSVRSVLVVTTDVTDLVAAEQTEVEQRELLAVLQRIMNDRGLFLEFMDETRRRVELLERGGLDRIGELRELHTLKGNVGLFGLLRSSRFFLSRAPKRSFAPRRRRNGSRRPIYSWCGMATRSPEPGPRSGSSATTKASASPRFRS